MTRFQMPALREETLSHPHRFSSGDTDRAKMRNLLCFSDCMTARSPTREARWNPTSGRDSGLTLASRPPKRARRSRSASPFFLSFPILPRHRISRETFIPDFSHWEENGQSEAAVARLLERFRAEETAG